MRRLLESIIAAALLLFASCLSGFAQANDPSANNRKVSVESFTISGTRSVDSAELSQITNSISGSVFDDDAEELQERIRAQFQDHGFFKAEVEKLDIKVVDPMASPKPVQLEAEVSEGPRCRLSGIEFTGNHALSSPDLRARFTIKAGDVFMRSKLASGLGSMRRVYGSRGFLDATFIPDTVLDSSSTVRLDIQVNEGDQYRMDQLEIVGPPEVAAKLQTRWELAPGAVFDDSYLTTFIDKNRSLLPEDFTRSNGVELFNNCGDATVSVHLHLTQDEQHAALDRAKHAECSSGKKAKSAE